MGNAAPHARGQSFMGPQQGSGSEMNMFMNSFGGASSTGTHARAQQHYPSYPTSMMGGMGGMGMQPNPMQNLFMMNAFSGGDLMNNDYMQDLGSMMMMNHMMTNPMMGGMGHHSPYGYGYPQTFCQYGARPVTGATTTSTTTPTPTTNASNFRNRGGIYENYLEMQYFNNLFNNNNKGGSITPTMNQGAPAPPPSQNTMDFNSLAAMEMALGDAQPDTADAASPVTNGEGTSATAPTKANTTTKSAEGTQ